MKKKSSESLWKVRQHMSKNHTLTTVMIVLSFAFIIIVILMFLSIRNEKKKKEKYLIYTKAKTKRSGQLTRYLYDFFLRWSVTKRFINKIKKQFEILYPGDSFTIISYTMKMMYMILIICSICVIFLFLNHFSYYGAICVVFTVYVSINELVYFLLEGKRVKLLQGLDKFMGEIGRAHV